MVSSRDGFITLIKFENDELGQWLHFHEIPKMIQPLFEWMQNYWDLATCEPTKTIEIVPTFISRKSTNVQAPVNMEITN